jgi:hypothetical protein
VQIASFRSELEREPERRARVRVGHGHGRVPEQRTARDLDLRQRRRAHPHEEPRCMRLHLLAEADHHLDAAPGSRSGSRERPVRRRSHARRMQARSLRQPLRHIADDLALEPDEPVGDQHDLPLRLASERPQGLLDPLGHLGASLGHQRVEPRERVPARRLADRLGATTPAARPAREPDQLEPIPLVKALHQGARNGLCLRERLAGHRAAGVGVSSHRSMTRRAWNQRRSVGDEAVTRSLPGRLREGGRSPG